MERKWGIQHYHEIQVPYVHIAYKYSPNLLNIDNAVFYILP